jgi:hypothetical protein
VAATVGLEWERESNLPIKKLDSHKKRAIGIGVPKNF